MNRLHLVVLVGLGTLSLAPTTTWGQAVSVDATSLMRRLDSIEQRMRSMEANKGTSPGQRPQPMVTGGAGAAYTLTDLDQRMGNIEREMSQVNGGSERVNFAIEKLAKRFDDFYKDVDMRLNALEAKSTMTAMPVQPVTVPVAQPVIPAAGISAQPVSAGAAPAAGVSGAAVMAVAGATPAAAAKTAPIPADISSTDLYNRAYAYLSATDYPNARVWLEEFLKRHPKDKLADNAWYWLGEVQLVQNNPSAAVVSFRNGLKNFPNGAKAAGNLYKMGIALEQLKQPELAKGAWQKLLKDYPKSPEAARAKEKMATPKPSA